MAEPKEAKKDEEAQWIQLAINAVSARLNLKFPQYEGFGAEFKAKCIEEQFDEKEVLIDDFAEGFDESTLLEDLGETFEVDESDKGAICGTILHTLNTFKLPPKTLNLGIFMIPYYK